MTAKGPNFNKEVGALGLSAENGIARFLCADAGGKGHLESRYGTECIGVNSA